MTYYRILPIERRLLRKINKAVYDYQMIEDNDKIMVGVSGGKDSMIIFRLLNLRKIFSKEKYDVVGCFVDLGFGGDTASILQEYYKKENLEFFVVNYKIFNGPEDKNINCFWCSFNRRVVLFREAEKRGIKKIVLAHHLDDFIETYLLNLIYHGEISTMSPKVELFGGKLYIIRPLVYVEEKETKAAAKILNLPVIHSFCKRMETSKRKFVKDLVAMLYKNNPMVKINIFRSLKRIKKVYLP